MNKFYYKIDYLYDGNEDFFIVSSSNPLSINQIIDFAIGLRDKNLFTSKEIWELDHDKSNEFTHYSLKQKLS
jgi:hypothetical protein